MVGVFSPKRTTNVLTSNSIVNDGGGGVMPNFGPFWRRDFSASDRSLLDKL